MTAGEKGAMIDVTTEKTAAWQGLCLEAFAEQDNRVRIPDGTAAVCAYGNAMTKVSHWGLPGRLHCRGFSAKHESEDLRISLSPLSARYGKCGLSQKNGCGVLVFGRRSLFVF